MAPLLFLNRAPARKSSGTGLREVSRLGTADRLVGDEDTTAADSSHQVDAEGGSIDTTLAGSKPLPLSAWPRGLQTIRVRPAR